MAVDWNLRDHSSNKTPMPGGIPDAVSPLALVAKLDFLCGGSFVWMPKASPKWLFLLLTLVQIAAAYFVMAIIWVAYVSWGNGIDAL